jgi:hypothetical protein
MAIGFDKKNRIIELLNNKISIRKTVTIIADEFPTPVARSTVERISKSLKEEKKDITQTAEILTDAQNHINDLKSKYDPEQMRKILNKSCSIAKVNIELDTIAGNAIQPLVEGGFVGASVYTNETMEAIKNGTINPEQIETMMNLNFKATKLLEQSKITIADAVMKEEEKTNEQTVIDFDEADTNTATNAYFDMMNN